MGLIIKEVCKAKNIPLVEVAKRIGISPVSLSQSLNGNPTLSRLQEVASVLGVDVSELFASASGPEIHGCIYVNGRPVQIKSRKDIEELLGNLE